jgi:hypothetical protein
VLGQTGVAEGEHPHEELGEVGRRHAPTVRDDPGDEGVEDLAAQPTRDARVVEGVREGRVALPDDAARVGQHAGDPSAEGSELDRVEVAARHGAKGESGLTDGVGDDPQPLLVADQHSGAELLQLQGVEVHPLPDRGVGGVEHLEAAVATEPVDDIGAHAAADRVGRLEDRHVVSEIGEPAGAAQAGESRADDDDVSVHGGPPPHGLAMPS